MNSSYLLESIKTSKLYLLIGATIITVIGVSLFVATKDDSQPVYLANAVEFRGACDKDDWDTFVNGGGGFLGFGGDDPCAAEVRYNEGLQSLDFILVYTGQDAFQPPDVPFFDNLAIPPTPYIFQSTGMHEGRMVDYFIYYETEEDFRNGTNGQIVITSTQGNSDPILLARAPLDHSFDILSGFNQCMTEGKSLLPWTEQCLSYEERGLGESPMANIDWEAVNRQTDQDQAEAAWQRAQEQDTANRRAAAERARQQAAQDQAEEDWQRTREQEIADRRTADQKAQEEAERQQRERLAQGFSDAGANTQRSAQAAREEAAAIAACDSTFLGIPAWYNGLARDSDCTMTANPNDENGLRNFIWRIALNLVEAVLRIVGYAAVGFIIYGGYKYMISAGSPDGMVAARKTIFNAVIGLVISVAAVAIVRTVSSGLGLS